MEVNNHTTHFTMPAIVWISILLFVIVVSVTITTLYGKVNGEVYNNIVIAIASGLIGFLTGKETMGDKTIRHTKDSTDLPSSPKI